MTNPSWFGAAVSAVTENAAELPFPFPLALAKAEAFVKVVFLLGELELDIYSWSLFFNVLLEVLFDEFTFLQHVWLQICVSWCNFPWPFDHLFFGAQKVGRFLTRQVVEEHVHKAVVARQIALESIRQAGWNGETFELEKPTTFGCHGWNQKIQVFFC